MVSGAVLLAIPGKHHDREKNSTHHPDLCRLWQRHLSAALSRDPLQGMRKKTETATGSDTSSTESP
jgi:hypothetical protein